MAQMKTPGVYIIEKNAFPNSVVEVATAVPAFIGTTSKAKDGTKDLTNIPTRITSMLEYEKYFGEAPEIRFTITGAQDPPTPQKGITDEFKEEFIKLSNVLEEGIQLFKNPPEENKESLLQEKLDAVIKEVATFFTGDEKNTESIYTKYRNKIDNLDKDTNITVIKDIDASKVTYDKNDSEQSIKKIIDALDKAYRGATALQKELFTQKTESVGKTNISTTIDGENFKIEVTDPRHSLYYHLKLFYLNGGGPCYIVSIGDENNWDKKDLFINGLQLLKKEMEPTMIVIPEAVNFSEYGDYKSILEAAITHCANMQSRIAILDVFEGFKSEEKTITNFRNINVSAGPSYAAVYYPWIQTTLLSDKNVLPTSVNSAQIPTDSELSKNIQKIDPENLHNILMQNWSTYKLLYNKILEEVNIFPPSSAIAGIYTLVDNTRGVWKAPANVGISSVVKPVVNIDNEKQEDLNMPMSGKAINAIRSFIGEGTKVWGARTLDGNSMDWRYINVRRTMIFLEQSIKNAARAYVFEPNDANTWINMKGMIDNFLRSVWKRGGLAGSTPEDAYSIHIGLGDTMTAEDILNGILRITILVAVSHPAEFIEITFQQQMQKS